MGGPKPAANRTPSATICVTLKDQVSSDVGGKEPKQRHETEDVDKTGNETERDQKRDMLEGRRNQMVLIRLACRRIH
jgi:hypothetical protein